MEAVDGQGGAAGNSVIKGYFGGTIELGHAHTRHHPFEFERQGIEGGPFEGGNWRDLFHDARDGDFAPGVFHGGQYLYEAPQWLWCYPAPITRMQIGVGATGIQLKRQYPTYPVFDLGGAIFVDGTIGSNH